LPQFLDVDHSSAEDCRNRYQPIEPEVRRGDRSS
jgi:hypothetical protein